MDIPGLVEKALKYSSPVDATKTEESCAKPREMTMEELAMSCPLKKLPIDDETESVQSESMESHVSTERSTAAPRIKLDDQGRIIIDEESLEIDEAEAVNKLKPLTMCSKPVLNSCTYRKRLWKRGPPWTTAETENFYKALSYVGADFQSMLQYFPNRSREDLKRKFIKEELCNRRRIDHALSTPASDLVPSFEEFDLKNEADSNEAFEVEDSKEPLAAIVAEQEDGIRRKMQRHSKSETSEEFLILENFRKSDLSFKV